MPDVAEIPMSTTMPPMSPDTPTDSPEARRLKFAGTFDTLIESNIGLTHKVAQLVVAVKVATAVQTVVLVAVGILVALHH